MTQTVRDRIADFVYAKRITMAEFERRCGLSTGYVSSMRRGFGIQKLGQVLKAYPDLNREWLLFGEGEMLKGVQHPSIIQNVEQTNSHGNTITASNDSNLANVVAEQSRQISKLIEMVDRLTHADRDREGDK